MIDISDGIAFGDAALFWFGHEKQVVIVKMETPFRVITSASIVVLLLTTMAAT